MRLLKIALVSWLLGLIQASPLSAKTLDIALVIPKNSSHIFWELVSDASQAGARQLDVNLSIHYTQNNRFDVRQTLLTVVNQTPKPDYIIFRPFSGNASQVFDIVEQSAIPFVTIEEVDYQDVGQPKGRYQYWIGEVRYDNRQGGALLADTLLSRVEGPLKTGVKQIVGIGGRNDLVSQHRNEGLLDAVEKKPNAQLLQVFSMNWDADIVRDRFERVNQRYPDTHVFWCSSDHMAMEVISQLRQRSSLNSRAVVGGFDWLPAALQAIAQGDMEASVGGHFMMGAVALVKVVDYHHNIDRFSGEERLLPYSVIHQSNVERYRAHIQQQHWKKVNYRYFLHSQNPQRPKFTFEQVMRAYTIQHQSQARDN